MKNRKKLYYLNDYETSPTLRIETSYGGVRCLWKAFTTLKAMESCKDYLAKEWNRK